jgi:ABC-type Fe3+-hydroxamate transport system substrate-binding protein
VARKTAALPKQPLVLIVDRTPGTLRDLYTATDGSYLAELVEIAGGHIMVQPVPHGYKKLAKEELLALNPAMILDLVQGPKSRFSENTRFMASTRITCRMLRSAWWTRLNSSPG